MWQSFLPEADPALAAADIEPLIALLRQIEANATVPEALRDQAAAVLWEYAARTAPFRPQGQDAPSPDERSGHKPAMIAAGFPSSATLLVPYFKITPGTFCPPHEGLPAEECRLCCKSPGGVFGSPTLRGRLKNDSSRCCCEDCYSARRHTLDWKSIPLTAHWAWSGSDRLLQQNLPLPAVQRNGRGRRRYS
jgi:hypothetical protein